REAPPARRPSAGPRASAPRRRSRSRTTRRAADLAQQEGARHLPVPLQRPLGGAGQGRDVLEGEPGEEAPLDEAPQLGVDPGEALEGAVEGQQVLDTRLPRRGGGEVDAIELHVRGGRASLAAAAVPRVVDEDLPHGAGGEREEVLAV